MGINLADKGYFDVPAATPGDFFRLPPDGYVCRIINAELTNSKAGNLMLVLFIDIAEGDFQGYFKAATDNAKKFNPNKKWDNTGIYRQLLFDNSNQRISSFFKGLISCIEHSNETLKININDFEASILRGLLCGFIFASEEYQKRDGSIGERVVIKFPKTIEDIRNHNFKIPDTKKNDKTASQDVTNDDFQGTPVNDFDVPF